MKKIVALLMTAVMTIGMATAAFAAPSPQPTTGTIVQRDVLPLPPLPFSVWH